eukprot:TRINITY_DN6894_c0_g1_i12.p1 TRINITY_DN6894_c0_g1~~TRINITY_DN6894_c0_g1_i12.p1  ORF type:complete len:191 (-),score=58.54 TRINITY_DN6894_c0_g1_i12:165-737(-)
MIDILIPVANGSEEIETCSTYDLLKRAGAKVTMAKVPSNAEDAKSLNVTLDQGMKIITDMNIEDAAKKPWTMIFVPGGSPGTENLAKSEALVGLLKRQKEEGRWIAAICAAPALVLAANGLLAGEKATCYPVLHDKLPDQSMAKEEVVVSNKIITSQSPGTAFKFSAELVKALFGNAKMEEVLKAAYPKP